MLIFADEELMGANKRENKFETALSLNDYRRQSWEWPTLGEAITTNQRIFLFMDHRLIGDNYYKHRWVYYANYEISLSWTRMNLIESAGCSKLVDAIQKRCALSDRDEKRPK